MGKMLGALTAAAALLSTLSATFAPAKAITAELAKKCRAMAVTAHPSARPGTRTGAQKAQNEYYRECVAKDGNMTGNLDDKPKTDDKAK